MNAPGPKPIERLVYTMALTAAMAVILTVGLLRWGQETEPRRVEIAYPESRLLAATAEDPAAPAAMLRAGVTTLVREPYTLEDMQQYGLAEIWHSRPDLLQIRLADDRLTGNAAMYLTGQLGLSNISIRLREKLFLVDARLPRPVSRLDPARYILEIPFGPMPEGFRRALRLPAGDWAAARDLDQFTQAVASLRPETVLPDWRGGTGAGTFFSAYMRTPWLRKPLIALPEFSLPAAGRAVLRRVPRRPMVQAHVLTERECAAASETRLRQRLVRAVRERGVRFLYVAPPREWPLPRHQEFVRTLVRDLTRAGFKPGAATSGRMLRVEPWVAAVITFGLGAALFIFIWRAALWAVGVTGRDQAVDRVLTIHLKPSSFRWTALLIALALLVIQFEGPRDWGLQITAFLIAVLTPLLGLSQPSSEPPTSANHQHDDSGVRGRKPLTRIGSEAGAVSDSSRETCGFLGASAAPGRWLAGTLADFLRVSAWSLGGGLAIAALLYQPDFVRRLSLFAGVKGAYALPLLLGAIYLFPQITDGDWWRMRFSREHRWSTVIGLALLLGLAALLILRSGNHAWLPAWSGELAGRDWLEQRLGARPRWKEFLIGHPLLLLGLAGRRLPGRPGRLWPELCVAVGLVGQVSLINSFCHIHTPLSLTLLRTANGLWLGALLGMGLIGAVRAVSFGKRAKARPAR